MDQKLDNCYSCKCKNGFIYLEEIEKRRRLPKCKINEISFSWLSVQYMVIYWVYYILYFYHSPSSTSSNSLHTNRAGFFLSDPVGTLSASIKQEKILFLNALLKCFTTCFNDVD